MALARLDLQRTGSSEWILPVLYTQLHAGLGLADNLARLGTPILE